MGGSPGESLMSSGAILPEAERAKDPPQVYTQIKLVFTVGGKVTKKAMEDAVRLSEEKYCSVSAMLAKTAKITSEIRYVE